MVTIAKYIYSLVTIYNYRYNTSKDLHLLHQELHLISK